MTASTLMIQGTASHVGKSVLVAALCRSLARRGYRVAPFKAQNMALNSAVTADGLEIGRSQAFQAAAAGIAPTVDMNPVLLKPSHGLGCQVVLRGKALGHYDSDAYARLRPLALEAIQDALGRLRHNYDAVIIEGAGSPAEFNLRHSDIANMRIARMADAPVLLVGDIDRGGVFASLFGTLAWLKPADRKRVQGLIVNKFRGDVTRFTPGVKALDKRCGVPVLGILPYLNDLSVDEEDSVALEDISHAAPIDPKADIAVVHLPHLSNFTDFAPLRAAGLPVRYVTRPQDLGCPALIILPGTKATLHDLEWLKATGLAGEIVAHARGGGRVLGICGGFQMLGRAIADPETVESRSLAAAGLALLDVQTTFGRDKALRQIEGMGTAGWLEGVSIRGYEIHHGVTRRNAGTPAILRIRALGSDVQAEDGALNSTGRIAGVYVHGLFDTPEARGALRSFLGLPPQDGEISAELVFERLADWVDDHLEMNAILSLLQLHPDAGRRAKKKRK